MTAIAPASLMAELDDAINDRSPTRRVEILRQVTNLLVSGADRLTPVQIDLFDGVLLRLIERADVRTLVELSRNLSGMTHAPGDAIRKLAFHEDAAVAAPVLRKSAHVSDADLIEIADIRGQEHLLAMAGRETLSETLSDLLVTHGDSVVRGTLAQNPGAHFSEAAYATLVRDAERDDGLTEKLGVRRDIPAGLLEVLVTKASAKVRTQILQKASPEKQQTIKAAIDKVAEQNNAQPRKPVDYTESKRKVVELNRMGKLNDQTVNRFAVQDEYNNVVAALSVLTDVAIPPIERLVANAQLDGLIVACKAARLNWATTTMIIHNRPGCAPPSKQQLERGQEMFNALALSTAQQTIRIWSAEKTAKKGDRPASASAAG